MKVIHPLLGVNIAAAFTAVALAPKATVPSFNFSGPHTQNLLQVDKAKVDGFAEQVVSWLNELSNTFKKTKGNTPVRYDEMNRNVADKNWLDAWPNMEKLLAMGIATGYVHELTKAEIDADERLTNKAKRYFLILDDKFPKV